MPTEAYVGLGSNVEPELHLKVAVEAIRDRFAVVDLSPAYRNSAVGFTGDDFLNLVIRMRCDTGPTALGRILSEIEGAAGRQRVNSSAEHTAAVPASRTLDLDLLLYGSVVDPELGLPRMDILRYAFVLRPLAELAPELVHPVTGQNMLCAWQEVADQGPLMRTQALGAA